MVWNAPERFLTTPASPQELRSGRVEERGSDSLLAPGFNRQELSGCLFQVNNDWVEVNRKRQSKKITKVSLTASATNAADRCAGAKSAANIKWAGNQEAVTFLGYRPIRS
jgi:hypothetical protein